MLWLLKLTAANSAKDVRLRVQIKDLSKRGRKEKVTFVCVRTSLSPGGSQLSTRVSALDGTDQPTATTTTDKSSSAAHASSRTKDGHHTRGLFVQVGDYFH